MRRRLLLALTTVLALGAAPAVAAASDPCGIHPWCNRSLTPEQRAELVVAAMTTQEKVDFLGGDDFAGGYQSGPDTHTGIQDGVPRLGVPTVFYTDGPLGPRQGPSTGLPAPLGLAATFDPALARLYGETVADESRAKGNDVVFGPTINIMRTPLGGRTYEAYGEDPFLTTRMAVSWIDGLQSQGVMADVKHFAENNQEGEDPTGQAGQPGAPIGVGLLGTRYLANAIVDDRTLHEVELRAFQAAIQQAHAATIMCSYNQVNGTYACENPHLLQTILRREWGFRGYVLADYGAAHDTIASLKGGLDFEPWPPAAYQPAEIDAALLAGVPPSVLDDHVRNTLATWFRFGIFDRAPPRNDDAQIDWRRDARRAVRIEEQAATLLADPRGLLPLHAGRLHRIAVIGRAADAFVTGGGSGNVTPHRFVSLLAGVRADAGSGVTVTYDDGSKAGAAVADARAADVAIVAASDYYTEGADRSCLSLECPSIAGNQDALIEQVTAANPRTVVVLESGGPDLTPWRGSVGALLEAWYPGGPGGQGVADVLFGATDPGGRLPATFPAAESQIPGYGDPLAYPGVADQVHYSEGLDVGYRWYDSRHEQPAFPFGFGLSYTTFRFSRLRVGRPSSGTGAIPVRLSVTNTGRRRGWAVPELYLHIPGSPRAPEPPGTLEGFAKLSLSPGRTRTVTIELDRRSLSYWNTPAQAFELVTGCDTIMVGSSSRSLPLRRSLAVGGGRCGRGAR